MLVAKDHAGKSLTRTTEQQRISRRAVAYEPLRFTEMPRQDQPRAPTQRLEHCLIFRHHRLLHRHGEITIASLRIFLQTLTRNRKLVKRRAEATLDLPLQHVLKFSARLRLRLHRENDRARRSLRQRQRPALLPHQARAHGEVFQHRRELWTILNVRFVKARPQQRLIDAGSRGALQAAHVAFNALELNYGSKIFFETDSAGWIPRLDDA